VAYGIGGVDAFSASAQRRKSPAEGNVASKPKTFQEGGIFKNHIPFAKDYPRYESAVTNSM